MTRALSLLAFVVCTSGCFKLDFFVWNARHCSTVDGNDQALCDEDKLCTTCDEDYPFASFGIAPELVKQTPVPLSAGVGGGETNDAYFIEAGPDGQRSDVTVLYSHGNFGSIEHYLNRVALLHQLGVNVFAIDFRGFGKSTIDVEPTEAEFMADVQAARQRLDVELAERVSSVAVMGYSAGALGAVEIARTSDNCALVLENPWPNVQVFADDSSFIGVPQSFVTADAWDNIAKMPEIDEPLLHLHGEKDATVRLELGQRLFSAATEPKEIVVIEGAEHGNFGNDVPTVMGAAYGEAIAAHLDARCR